MGLEFKCEILPCVHSSLFLDIFLSLEPCVNINSMIFGLGSIRTKADEQVKVHKVPFLCMLCYVTLCYATPEKLHLFTRTTKYTTSIYKETSKGQRLQLGQKEAESGE